MTRSVHDERTDGPVATERPTPYDSLKQAILLGKLEPGQSLVETALATWLQISRTPVREALKRLEQDGLVQRGDRGLVVRPRSPEEILDIYAARIVLEGAVGRTAAERRTEYDVRALWRIVEKTPTALPGEDRRMDFNRQFHRAMWRASHNDSLVDLLDRLDLHLSRYPATTLSYPGRWIQAGKEHVRLVQAVEDRDGELAQEIATVHFTAARDIRLKLLWDEPEI